MKYRIPKLQCLFLAIWLLSGNLASGQSNLLDAVRKGDHATVKQLIKQKKADIDLADSMGHTPLMIASGEGYITIVKMLLKQKPAIDLRNYFGESALMMAVQGGHTDVVILLLKHGANVNLTDRKGWTALMLCRSNIVGALLLKHGADVNHQTASGAITALMVAAEEGNVLLLKLLLQSCADPARVSAEGLKAVDYAKRKGHQDIVALLNQK